MKLINLTLFLLISFSFQIHSMHHITSSLINMTMPLRGCLSPGNPFIATKKLGRIGLRYIWNKVRPATREELLQKSVRLKSFIENTTSKKGIKLRAYINQIFAEINDKLFQVEKKAADLETTAEDVKRKAKKLESQTNGLAINVDAIHVGIVNHSYESAAEHAKIKKGLEKNGESIDRLNSIVKEGCKKNAELYTDIEEFGSRIPHLEMLSKNVEISREKEKEELLVLHQRVEKLALTMGAIRANPFLPIEQKMKDVHIARLEKKALFDGISVSPKKKTAQQEVIMMLSELYKPDELLVGLSSLLNKEARRRTVHSAPSIVKAMLVGFEAGALDSSVNL